MRFLLLLTVFVVHTTFAGKTLQESKNPEVPELLTELLNNINDNPSQIFAFINEYKRSREKKEIRSIREQIVSSFNNTLKETVDLEVKDLDGATPLIRACEHDIAELAEVLIDNNANVSAVGSMGWTPLHWAIIHANNKLEKKLRDRGASQSTTDDAGQSPASLKSHKVSKQIHFKPISELAVKPLASAARRLFEE